MIEQNAEIVFNEPVAHQTFLIGLNSREIVREAEPGRFVMIRVSEGLDPLLRRPFSICGIRENRLFLILYRVVGKGTFILSQKRKGERLPVLGPLGRGFQLPGGGQRPVFVSGGIGVAPLLYLAQEVKAEGARFMMGYRSSGERVPLEGFDFAHVEVIVSTDDGTAGHRGLVTELFEDYLAETNRESLAVYTCGPKPMLKRMAAVSAERGLACQVSLEAFMACGLGACQGCAVKASPSEDRVYYHVCQDGPVFPVESLDWESL